MSAAEQQALHRTPCVLCGHPLIVHHPSSLRCHGSVKRHWWSRRRQCPCDMEPR